MLSYKDIENVREAYGIAWADAAKYGNEVHNILNMSKLINMRDSTHLLDRTVKTALIACDDWKNSMILSTKLIAKYNSMLIRG